MTLDAAEVAQVTEIAARVTAEMARNMVRGTGGATLPLPIQRLGTVGGTASAGAEVSVRADGDENAVPAVNATGMVVEAGDRVVIEWRPVGKCYVVHQLSRAQRGNWTPELYGPSSNAVNATAAGHYTRHGHRVTVYGRFTLGSGGGFGTAAGIQGLPFPVISDGDGIPAVLPGYITSSGVSRPLTWVIGEGASGGQLWWHNAFGAVAVRLDPLSTTGPVAQQAGDYVSLHGTYDTDAA